MQVTVTVNDLHAAGITAESCPIAQALKRKYNASFVTVYGDKVTVHMNGKRVQYRPSKEARAFMRSFDLGNTVRVPCILSFRHIPAKGKP